MALAEYRRPAQTRGEWAAGEGFRVALLVDGAERPYGIWQALLALSEGLRSFGCEAALISLHEGELARAFRQRGLAVRVLGTARHALVEESVSGFRECLGRWAVDPGLAEALDAALRDLRPDALHVAERHLLALAGRAARRAAVPCLWEASRPLDGLLHGSLDRACYQWICRSLGIQPLATSTYMARNLKGPGLRPHVVPLGVDVERFHPARVEGIHRRELNLPAHAIVFAIAAELAPALGQDRFLRALAAVGELDGQPLHLLLMGGPLDGEYAAYLRRLARESRAEDRLHLVGPVDRPEEYYAAVDIAVNSRLRAEPFGLAVVEAMAMERPVLAHALGGPAETVLDGVTGWHVLRAGTGDFRRGIVRAVADRRAWYTLRKAARRRAVQRYSLRARAERYVQVLRALRQRGD